MRLLLGTPPSVRLVKKSVLLYPSFRPPNIPDVRGAGLELVNSDGGAELKNLEVLRFYEWFERGKVNSAGARRAVVAAGKLDVVNVKTEKSVAL